MAERELTKMEKSFIEKAFEKADRLSFNDYVILCHLEFVSNPTWRVGQTYFNVLHNVRPKLANSIRSSTLDCFFRDQKLPAFLEYVASEWDNFQEKS